MSCRKVKKIEMIQKLVLDVDLDFIKEQIQTDKQSGNNNHMDTNAVCRNSHTQTQLDSDINQTTILEHLLSTFALFMDVEMRRIIRQDPNGWILTY